MEFLFDSANLEAIEKYAKIYPIMGVTSNPSILKAEGKISFFPHMRAIRQIIGYDKTLHIQIIARDYEGIMKEAEALLRGVDDQVYIKIPTNEEGLRAMRILKRNGIHVTATAIYSKIQGFMAIAAGADYIAPYDNRMASLDIDPGDTISSLRRIIDQIDSPTKILAASFKNVAQVNAALQSGAHVVTIQPQLLHEAFAGSADIQKAIADFHADWVSIHGDVSICDLLREGSGQ